MEAKGASSRLRVAHFTDMHVTADPSSIPWRDLISKRLLGWINLAVLRRQRLFAGTEDVVRAFLADLEEVRPDHIVSTGDLTGLGLPVEFEAARKLLEPLLDDPRVIGIPGNHDVYVRSAVRDRLYEKAFGAWTRTDLRLEDFPEEFRGLYPYPLVRFLGGGESLGTASHGGASLGQADHAQADHGQADHGKAVHGQVTLVALKDVKPNPLHDSTGRVGRLQLRALEHVLTRHLPSRLGTATTATTPRPTTILAAHVGVFRSSGRRDPWHHRLRDGGELLDLAARAGVSLFIHGHTHGRFVFPAGAPAPVAMANPGSLTSACHARAYHIYTVDGGSIEVEVRRYDPSRKAFFAWPEGGVTLGSGAKPCPPRTPR